MLEAIIGFTVGVWLGVAVMCIFIAAKEKPKQKSIPPEDVEGLLRAIQCGDMEVSDAISYVRERTNNR